MMSRRLILFVSFFCIGLMLVSAPLRAGQDKALWIEAWGHASMSKGDTRNSAQRRALIDALVSAGLQGGATLRSYTYADKGNIVADRALLLARGQILRHKVIESRFDGTMWQVKVHALVGPMPAGLCGGSRTMIITAQSPRMHMSPAAPAWVPAMVNTVYSDFLKQIERNPATRLDRITSATGFEQSGPITGNLSYTNLTRGTAPTAAAGDHVLQSSFGVDVQRRMGSQTIVFGVDLAIRESNGNLRRHRIERTAAVPQNTTLHTLVGRTRNSAQAALTKGVQAEFDRVLNTLTCEPPSARLAFSGGSLSVPVGKRHGLTRGSLAVLDDPNDSFGLLEIVKLTNSRAVLRPLNPARPAQSFSGRLVYFMEAGL